MRKNDPNQIWFLTAIVVDDTRTFGYYRGFRNAYKAVQHNRCDMQECLYQYIVMECIGEGVHAQCTDEEWFRWTGRKWTPCRPPKMFQGFTNWALG